MIQTSAMDCGPACLTALLRGFGVRASYGRLREACQTDVDGTSIDTLEDIANQLGLAAVQTLVPVDHLWASPSRPAIVVTRLPSGAPHFVVLWARARGRVQVMDPARGRRWIDQRRFGEDLYVHEQDVPAADWRAWAETDDLRGPLARRLRALGVGDADDRITRALAEPGWRPIATLDAATRMVASVIADGGLAAGAGAARLLDGLVTGVGAIPAAYWSVQASGDDALRLRGAVVLEVTGVQPASPASRELAASLDQPAPRPWRTLTDALYADGALRPAAVALGIAAVAAGVVGEAILFRALFDLGDDLVTAPQLITAVLALVGFLIAMLLVEVPTRVGALALGRRTELRVRVALLAKLPRLGLHYLRSRPISDMAERGHALHRLRELPPLAVRVLRAIGEIVVTAAALAWLVPGAAPYALALALAAIVPPVVAQRALAERELRMRTHVGALAQFTFDALVGTLPARASGIEVALRREHEGLVAEWSRAAGSEHRLALAVTALQAVVGFALAIALVLATAAAGGTPASLLLAVYWALAIPTAGQLLTEALRELPAHRNLTLRLLEPLGALDVEVAPAIAAVPPATAVALELAGVSVMAGGHRILHDLDLTVQPGEHVAIVGVSGGGKSTLLGLLLGWSRPAAGTVRVDGELLDGAGVAALRQQTVWIDPGVTLWNDTLAANLRYGAPTADVAGAVADAELELTIARLPEGLATRLGEGGGLISGGEGQRVRLGRGLARPAPRLVLLDEPMRGLDRASRQRLLAAARERWRGATLLCVSHDVGETRTFPRVLVLEHGQIVEDGAPDQLAARAGSRYAALVASEARAQEIWRRWRRVELVDGRLEERS